MRPTVSRLSLVSRPMRTGGRSQRATTRVARASGGQVPARRQRHGVAVRHGQRRRRRDRHRAAHRRRRRRRQRCEVDVACVRDAHRRARPGCKPRRPSTARAAYGYAVRPGSCRSARCHSRGPVSCTDVPRASTATVTGMSLHVELVDRFHAEIGERDDARRADRLRHEVRGAADGHQVGGACACGSPRSRPARARPCRSSRSGRSCASIISVNLSMRVAVVGPAGRRPRRAPDRPGRRNR